jgi:hypothetical protein
MPILADTAPSLLKMGKLCESMDYPDEPLSVWKHAHGYSLDLVSKADIIVLAGWHRSLYPGSSIPGFEEGDELVSTLDFMQSFMLRLHDQPLLRLDITLAEYHSAFTGIPDIKADDYAIDLQLEPFHLPEPRFLLTGWMNLFDFLFSFPEVGRLLCRADKQGEIGAALLNAKGFQFLAGAENMACLLPKAR